jgi:glycosyltransferase involved in cell wall biosynthesis
VCVKDKINTEPSNMKILVVVDSVNINDSSGSKANVALINNLTQLGFDVKIYHYTRKNIQLPGIECVLSPEKKWNLYFLLSRLERIFTRITKINLNPFFEKRFGFSFTFFNDVNSLAASINKEKVEDFDYVLTLSKGTSFRPHAALLKLPHWHNKWLAYVHDPYPQHLYPRPYNFVEYGYKQKRCFFRDITKSTHKIIFPSLLLKEWMQSYFKQIEGKSLIIPHQIDSNISSEIKSPDFFNSSCFNILHAGNLLDLRDPKPLILAFENFLAKTPHAKENARLSFIGNESIYHEYLKQKQNKVKQVFVSDGYISFEDVYSMQQLVDVNVILEAKSEISPFLPGKFAHCVAADKPILVIGPYYSECKRLLGNEYPYMYDFKEIDGITNALILLYTNWKDQNNKNKLNRLDLVDYLGLPYLKEIFENKLPTLDE